jgi:hypothetical protein
MAKRRGKLKGKQPKLPESAQRSIRRRYITGEVCPSRSRPPNFQSTIQCGRGPGRRVVAGAGVGEQVCDGLGGGIGDGGVDCPIFGLSTP